MQQLLEITTIPIKWELEVEHARLEMQNNWVPDMDTTRTPGRLNIDTQNISLRLDTSAARESLGRLSGPALVRQAAAQGRRQVLDGMGQTARDGTALARVEDGVTIAQLVRQKLMEQPGSYTMFLPSAGPEISWDPARLDLEYQTGSVNTQWEQMRNVLNYVPGSVRFKILQHPRVEIRYLGKPFYFPPSASPDYAESETAV